MLAFPPGQLSTVAGPVPGPVRNFVDGPDGAVARQPGPPNKLYNFADLPCPPPNVQVSQNRPLSPLLPELSS